MGKVIDRMEYFSERSQQTSALYPLSPSRCKIAANRISASSSAQITGDHLVRRLVFIPHRRYRAKIAFEEWT